MTMKCALLIAITALLGRAQTSDLRVAILTQALDLRGRGEPTQACAKLQEVSGEQRDHLWTTARLNLAEIAQSCVTPGDSAGLYDEVIRLGDPADAALARNNKAIFWLDTHPDDSIRLLDEIFTAPGSDAVPDADRAIYRANQGNAYERLKAWDKALSVYQTAISEGLALPETAAATARTLVELTKQNPQGEWRKALLPVVSALASQGGLSDALVPVDSLAAKWSEIAGRLPATDLVAAFISSASAATFEAASVRRTLVLLAPLPEARAITEELSVAAFDTNLKPALSPSDIEKQFPVLYSLKEPRRKGRVDPQRLHDASCFYERVGGYFLAQRERRSALARYSVAWLLDPSNTQAARTTAFLIHDYPDLEGSQALRERLLKTYRAGRAIGDWAFLPKPITKDLYIATNPVAIKNIVDIYMFVGLPEKGIAAAKVMEAALQLRTTRDRKSVV